MTKQNVEHKTLWCLMVPTLIVGAVLGVGLSSTVVGAQVEYEAETFEEDEDAVDDLEYDASHDEELQFLRDDDKYEKALDEELQFLRDDDVGYDPGRDEEMEFLRDADVVEEPVVDEEEEDDEEEGDERPAPRAYSEATRRELNRLFFQLVSPTAMSDKLKVIKTIHDIAPDYKTDILANIERAAIAAATGEVEESPPRPQAARDALPCRSSGDCAQGRQCITNLCIPDTVIAENPICGDSPPMKRTYDYPDQLEESEIYEELDLANVILLTAVPYPEEYCAACAYGSFMCLKSSEEALNNRLVECYTPKGCVAGYQCLAYQCVR